MRKNKLIAVKLTEAELIALKMLASKKFEGNISMAIRYLIEKLISKEE
jgi:hypothetical protein